jgi:hypothetical protein
VDQESEEEKTTAPSVSFGVERRRDDKRVGGGEGGE